jgi:hypothetical protein
MKKYFNKFFKIISIDVLVYHISTPTSFQELENFTIQKHKISVTKTIYYIKESDEIIHRSYLFTKLHVLSLIGKKGPAIGECFTENLHRGKSIYPFVINKIANEVIIKHRLPEIFILVNSNNLNSIKGIEKAGFVLHSKIVAKRFLFLYFKKKIQKFI